MKRRSFLVSAATAAGVLAAPALAAQTWPLVQVFKNPSCGCCEAWVEHLKGAGFQVKVTEVDDTAPVRKRYGIPDKFGSCHTGVASGYALEGHVPAGDIKRLLATRPRAAGLAVPGMPVGSPGMEAGSRKDPFDVLLVDKTGGATVYASYNKS